MYVLVSFLRTFCTLICCRKRVKGNSFINLVLVNHTSTPEGVNSYAMDKMQSKTAAVRNHNKGLHRLPRISETQLKSAESKFYRAVSQNFIFLFEQSHTQKAFWDTRRCHDITLKKKKSKTKNQTKPQNKKPPQKPNHRAKWLNTLSHFPCSKEIHLLTWHFCWQHA